ncbi:hypothetical protein HAX54_012884 [Datura stramonium]|uniref:Uncharacterized protein n=1 Tax=Datura stramonium TaxID=4076 RepID=A0ABS8RXZ8_DATST|nr:hypothetical protein [Datura stramonium]
MVLVSPKGGHVRDVIPIQAQVDQRKGRYKILIQNEDEGLRDAEIKRNFYIEGQAGAGELLGHEWMKLVHTFVLVRIPEKKS